MNITCPSCNHVVNASAGFCPLCGMPSTQKTEPLKPIVQTVTRPKVPLTVILAIVLDRTGSSKVYATGILLVIKLILEMLNAKIGSVRVWLQTHGDLDLNEATVLVTDGVSPQAAIQQSQSIVFAGGGDPPESHLDALEAMVKTVPWVADPKQGRGAILFITTANTKPARSGITTKELGQEIKRRGLLLYEMCEPFPFHHELAHETGGLIFRISNNPDPAELEVIAAQLSASIAATVSSGATAPMTV